MTTDYADDVRGEADALMREAFKRSRTFDIAYTAEPTASLFHWSEAFYKSIRGPLGSGKSVCCVIELVRRAREQAPDKRGVRRTRWGVIRNTYPMLESTTIKTWMDWIPDEVAPIKHSPLLTTRLRLAEADGTTVDCEVFFVSMDKPDDVAKLKSMDLTGIWLNEISELPKSAFDMSTGRVGRFPPKKDVPLTWCGIISDTNSMDDEHWHCKLEEGVNDDEEVKEMHKQLREALLELGFDRPLMEFYVQPPALLEANGTLIPNPNAENARNQQLGHAYWLNMVAGKDQNWINVYILNRHGRVIDGLPCYPEYVPEIHGKKRNLVPYEGLPIDLGMDFGLSPAIVPIQCTPDGILLIYGELCAEERSMGTRSFVRDAMSPYLTNRFGTHHKFKIVGDPAGSGRDDSDENTSYKELASAGYSFEQGKTNDWIPRRESVAWFLGRIVKGQPAFQLDGSARLLRAGFEGRYHYRRLRVAGEARFEEKAYKNKWSHCFVAGTVVATPNGGMPIESLAIGDYVETDIGPRRVTAVMNRVANELVEIEYSSGVTVTCTVDHPFYVKSNGWVRADELQYGDILAGIAPCFENQSVLTSNSTASDTTKNRTATIDQSLNDCIASCGHFIMGLFLPTWMFTIKTRTRTTTTSRTLSAFQKLFTRVSIQRSARMRIRMPLGSTCSMWSSLLPETGTGQRLDALGTRSTQKSHGKTSNQKNSSASSVAARIKHMFRSADSVLCAVRTALGGGQVSTTNHGTAPCAGTSSSSTNTQKQKHAHVTALAVASVKLSPANRSARVYDLTVEEAHCFYAGGALVHNCQDALQYAAMNYATVGLQEMKLLSTPRWMQRLAVRGSAVRPYQMRGGSSSYRKYTEH